MKNICMRDAVKELNSVSLESKHINYERPSQNFVSDTELITVDYSEFVVHFNKCSCDFIYDARSGLIFSGIQRHHMFMSGLYNLYADGTGNPYTDQDAYIEQGMGMFKSKAGTRILM